MVFNSFSFLIFFPVVAIVYYLIPYRVRYIWLLAASWFFYMQWNAIYLLLLLYSTAVAYAGGRLLEKFRASGKSRICFGVCLALSFIPLIYFKYTGFIISNINNVFIGAGSFAPLDVPDILLPIGISFFTFQAAGYVIDVYRGDVEAERDPLRFALFVSFFPQLVAGPIERTKNLLPQLECRVDFDHEKARDGFWLMLWGYAMKVVIADRIAIFVDCVYDDCHEYGGVFLIIASALFALQIYCDFAGYSTIAIGAAQILGIRLMDNFDSPYLSGSVSEFWRRWHISLTTWFRDYLYIPLGGNRKGKIRKYINKLVVFTVSGLWHGAEWSFAAWGGINGLFLVAEEICSPLSKRVSAKCGALISSLPVRILKVIATFILVDLTWIFFRAQTMEEALYIISNIFHTDNWNALTDGSIFECGLDNKNFILLFLMILLLFFVDRCRKKGVQIRKKAAGLNLCLRALYTATAVVFILLFGIWGGTYNAEAFIYFRF
ncbi:MAG: MBOAT family protein [Lachnospiraceae bacterium]|nr:MBOAT family protein [Lachnospiraceae bacterium]